MYTDRDTDTEIREIYKDRDKGNIHKHRDTELREIYKDDTDTEIREIYEDRYRLYRDKGNV